MDFWLKIRLKVNGFFRKYKNAIILVIIAWAIVIAINYLLKYLNDNKAPSTTYTPNKAVMDDSTVPSKLQEPINELISQFVGYCNDKNYEAAYNLIDDECKDALYPSIDIFKLYVNNIYKTKKIYNIQNFSNVGKNYIYDVRILDDIIATGTNGSGYVYYEEKFVMKDTKNGLKMSIGGFVDKEDLNIVAEDEYLKFNIQYKLVDYETETYVIEITNRSQYPIILQDGTLSNEIELNIETQKRSAKNSTDNLIMINPRDTKTFKITFTKFVDDGNNSTELIFNAIRVLNSYSGDKDLREQEVNNAVDKYSLNIKLEE